MKNELTVTVGIPAYNEEANIGRLLESLFSQKQEKYKLEKIIVISDVSTDNTVNIIKSYKKSFIEVVENKERRGKPLNQNYMFSHLRTDVLLILDADVLIKDQYFIANMILPFIKDETVGLVGAKTEPLPSKTFIEAVVNHSTKMKIEIAEEFNNSDNIFLCHGRARAFSKKLTTEFKFVSTAGEDAYSYLQCKLHHYKFVYAKNAVVLYRSPQTLKDHLKQSMRYFNGRKALEDYFSNVILFQNFSPPSSLILRKTIKYFIFNPVLIVSYYFVLFYSKINSYRTKMGAGKWDVSTSSKTL